MSIKSGIRVIKKSEMNKVDMLTSVKRDPKKDAAVEMVRTVMNWVNDLKSRKLEETRHADKQFQLYG